MPRPPIELSGDSKDFVEFFGKTSKIEPGLKRSLRKGMKQHADTVATDVKAEVRKPPLMRGRSRLKGVPSSRGLRSKIAAGVSVSLAASSNAQGAKITAAAKSLPPQQKRLLRLYNKEAGWRHPGIRRGRLGGRKWYPQKGRPFFGAVINRHRPELEQVARDAIEEARRSAGL